MSEILWLTCPACRYRFYIVADDAGKNHDWFCPSCKMEFPEEQGLQSNRSGSTSGQT